MWNSPETLPKDGGIIRYEAVRYEDADDGEIISTGLASYKGISRDDGFGEYVSMKWIVLGTTCEVYGRLVRWKYAEEWM